MLYIDKNEATHHPELVQALRDKGIEVNTELSLNADYVIGDIEEKITKEEVFSTLAKLIYYRLHIIPCDNECIRKAIIKSEKKETLSFSKKEENTKGNGDQKTEKEQENFKGNIIEKGRHLERQSGMKGTRLLKEDLELEECKNSLRLKVTDAKFVEKMIFELSRFIIWMNLINKKEDFLSVYQQIEPNGKDFNSSVETVMQRFTFLLTDLNYPIIQINSGIGIERKAAWDFLASIYDGRLWDQLERLVEHFEHPLLLIEGSLREALRYDHRVKSYRKPSASEYYRGIRAELTTLFNWSKVKIEKTIDFEETVAFLIAIHQTYDLGKSGRVPSPRVPKSQKPEEIRRNMLCCIRGIGPKKAGEILKILNPFTPRKSWFEGKEGFEELLKQVKGLGKKRELIMKVFGYE